MNVQISIVEENQNFEHNIKKEPEEEFLCILPSFHSANTREEDLVHVKQENNIRTEGNTKFQCKICHKVCGSNNYLKRHEKTHQKKQCRVCNNKVRPQSFEKHSISHQNEKTERKFECKICSCKFLTKGQLNYHVLSHSRRFQCDLCGHFSASSKHHLLIHLNLHLAPGQFKCFFCRKLFDDRESFRFHSRQVHGDPKNRLGLTKADLLCRTCGKESDDVTARKQHEKMHEEKVQCPICDLKFKPQSLANHLKLHELRKKVKKNECKICQMKFYTKRSLHCHIKSHFKSLECDLCEYRTGLKQQMKHHMANHMKVKPFKCEICHRGFSLKANLKNHQPTHFLPFRCNLCPVSFILKKNLNRHIKTHDQFKNMKDWIRNFG